MLEGKRRTRSGNPLIASCDCIMRAVSLLMKQALFTADRFPVNIWTHGLGTLAYSAIPLYLYYTTTSRYEQATFADISVLGIFFASVTICFLFSTRHVHILPGLAIPVADRASFHVCMNHSPRIWHIGSLLDHLGIVLVIWGSTVPSAHFGFYCDPMLQLFYWALVSNEIERKEARRRKC